MLSSLSLLYIQKEHMMKYIKKHSYETNDKQWDVLVFAVLSQVSREKKSSKTL